MSEWDDTAKEAGFDDPSQESKFVSLNEGADEVVTYVKHERVECTDEDKYCGDDGMTIEYYFTSPLTGKERTLRRSSKGVFYAFKNAKVEPGETIKIVRTGEGQQDTRYEITKLTPEEIAAWKEEKEKAIAETEAKMPEKSEPEPEPPVTAAKDEEINIEDIPF